VRRASGSLVVQERKIRIGRLFLLVHINPCVCDPPFAQRYRPPSSSRFSRAVFTRIILLHSPELRLVVR
jgi:hypothetical protein